MVAQEVFPNRVVQLRLHVDGNLLEGQVVFLGLSEGILETIFVFADDFQCFCNHVIGGKHAVFVGFQHVSLKQDAGTVAGGSVGFRKHGGETLVKKRCRRVAPRMELDVTRDRHVVAHHGRADFRLPFVAQPSGNRGVVIAEILHRIGGYILVICAIGGMGVEKQVGLPLVKQGGEGPQFGRIEFGKVAVEVQALGIHAPAHLFRTVLVDAVVWREVGQPVGAQHRDEKEREFVQKVLVFPSRQHVTDEHKHSILAVGFARMDARLDQDDVFSAPTNLLRAGVAVLVNDEQGYIAALGSLPNALVMHFLELLVQQFSIGYSPIITICLQIV